MKNFFRRLVKRMNRKNRAKKFIENCNMCREAMLQSRMNIGTDINVLQLSLYR